MRLKFVLQKVVVGCFSPLESFNLLTVLSGTAIGNLRTLCTLPADGVDRAKRFHVGDRRRCTDAE